MSAASSGSSMQTWLERLGKALAYLDPECDTAELSRRVVEAAHEQFGMPGARLWRVNDGAPTVWQEMGSLSDADAGFISGAIAGASAGRADGSRWACALPGDGVAASALEISAGGPLDEAAQSILQLFSRYAGVALASSARRGAMADLQSIIEATKSLNSSTSSFGWPSARRARNEPRCFWWIRNARRSGLWWAWASSSRKSACPSIRAWRDGRPRTGTR